MKGRAGGRGVVMEGGVVGDGSGGGGGGGKYPNCNVSTEGQ